MVNFKAGFRAWASNVECTGSAATLALMMWIMKHDERTPTAPQRATWSKQLDEPVASHIQDTAA